MNIVLRELCRADLSTLNGWRNDPSVIGLLGSNFLHISPEIEDRWFDAYLSNRSSAVRLAIVDAAADDAFVGTVQLTSIHHINRNAEFSIMIGRADYWSKGVGRVASAAMLRHGFEDLNLHRIYLTVLTDNERAVRLYTQLGFQNEGILRGSVFKNGTYRDMIAMAILKE